MYLACMKNTQQSPSHSVTCGVKLKNLKESNAEILQFALILTILPLELFVTCGMKKKIAQDQEYHQHQFHTHLVHF